MEQIRRIGFLGGGQLSRMLVESLKKLRAEGETEALELCLVEDQDCPVSHVTSHIQIGRAGPPHLKDFLSHCQVVTFENEFIEPNSLRDAIGEKVIHVRPSVQNLEVLQNKILQKELLGSLQVPCAHHQLFHSRAETEKHFGATYILKWAKLGYDGKGVLFVDSSTRDSSIEKFLAEAKSRSSPVFAEKRIHFIREIAVVAARNHEGQCLIYPPVETVQNQGVCEWVTSLGVESEQAMMKIIEPWVRALLNKLNYVGVLAIEMFETSESLFVNELAPRVHNSGHYSQLALTESQFASHVRAVLGLPLKNYEKKFQSFGMMNLLGPKGREFATGRPSEKGLPKNSKLYWYDKSMSKPGRKMGHINFVAQNQEELSKIKEDLILFRNQLWQS